MRASPYDPRFNSVGGPRAAYRAETGLPSESGPAYRHHPIRFACPKQNNQDNRSHGDPWLPHLLRADPRVL